MDNVIEGGLLIVALLFSGYLVRDLLPHRIRRRHEAEHVGHLAGDAPEEDSIVEPSLIEKRLKAAGVTGPPEAYIFATSILAALVSIVMLRVVPAIPAMAIIAVVFTLYFPWMVTKELARRRARLLEQQLSEAIDLMVGSLHAGGNLAQALRSAAPASDQPLREELDEATRRLALGMEFERAFSRVIERYDGEGVRLFIQTLAAKQQAGGDLVPVLQALNETLRDRWRQQRMVRAQMSGARLTAIIIVLLPYLFAPILAWLQPGWFAGLLSEPLGLPLVFLAVMLQCVGILWVWRILGREL